MTTDAVRNDLSIYDDVAAHWWTEQPLWVRTLQNMVPARLKWFDRFVDWQGSEVLDIGCAGGFMAEAIHDCGGAVTGIDPAGEAIDAARRHAAQTGRDIRYDTGVGEQLPYEDCSFDTVVCVDVLEHVESVPTVLREVLRVLKPEGRFLFDTINRNRLSRFAAITMAERVLRILPRGTHDPDLFIKPSELREQLLDAGLKPGPTTGLGPSGITLRGELKFSRLPFRSVIYMGVADKASR